MSKDKKTQAPTNNNFTMRGKQRTFHHLFKAEVASFLKNTSWQQGVVTLHPTEHVHHFHTVNSMGVPQKITTQVGGHYHEVTWELSPDGLPVAKCGPAMRKVVRKTPLGPKSVVERVKFRDEVQGRDVLDTHSHEMSYLGTDELSLEGIQAIQQRNAQAINAADKDRFENDEVSMQAVDR